MTIETGFYWARRASGMTVVEVYDMSTDESWVRFVGSDEDRRLRDFEGEGYTFGPKITKPEGW